MTPKEVAARVRERFKNPGKWKAFGMGDVDGPMCLVGGVRAEIFGDTRTVTDYRCTRTPEEIELYTKTLTCIVKTIYPRWDIPAEHEVHHLERRLTRYNDTNGYYPVLKVLERAEEVCP